jgi:membrane-associated protein
VLPGVLAVSAFHQYFGVPHHGHPAKHIWILTVVGVAIVLGVAAWIYRRRSGGGVAAVKPQA